MPMDLIWYILFHHSYFDLTVLQYVSIILFLTSFVTLFPFVVSTLALKLVLELGSHASLRDATDEINPIVY